MNLEFATADRILLGEGVVDRLPELLPGWGRRFLAVTGRGSQRHSRLFDSWKNAGLEIAVHVADGEPAVEAVSHTAAEARAFHAEGVIGLGGGSALDAAKATAALATNPGDVYRYLEVVGEGRPLDHAPLPFIAIPTTAGTGTEVTRNAVLAATQHRVKVSLRSPAMLARLAVVDPELTYGLPPDVTAATGLDALTQLMEAFVSCRANPLTDGCCREGLIRAARSLPVAFAAAQKTQHEPEALTLAEAEKVARADMAFAALLSGLALANAGLGAVHGFAGPIGGMFPAPHGAVCAALLPEVMQANLAALRLRAPTHPALDRYAEVARLLTDDPTATADAGVTWVRTLCARLSIPPLRVYGLTSQDVATLAEAASRASSMKGNPIALTPAELCQVLTASL